MYESVAYKFNAKQNTAIEKLIDDNNSFPITNISSAFAPSMIEFPTVSMQSLVESDVNNEVNQFEIVVSKVFNLVVSFLTTGTIYQHLNIGYINYQFTEDGIEILDDSFVLTSGRHRLTALLTLAELLSASDDEFLTQYIPVLPSPYSVEAIEHANGSRAMTPAEKTAILVQSKGIDSQSFDDVLTSQLDGTLPAKALGLAFSLKAEGSALEPTTLSAIGLSFIRQLRNSRLQAKRLFSTYEGIELAYNYAASVLDEVLSNTRDKNHARNATSIATTLSAMALKYPAIVDTLSGMEAMKPAVKEKKTKALSTTRKPNGVSAALRSVEEEVTPKTKKRGASNPLRKEDESPMPLSPF